MNVRLALNCVLVTVLLIAVPTVAFGQFGLSASPDLLPWLKSPPSSDTGFYSPPPGGAGTSAVQQEEGPPMPTGWLAPLNGGHSGFVTQPEPQTIGAEMDVRGRPDGIAVTDLPSAPYSGYSPSHQADSGSYRDLLEIPNSGIASSDCPSCFDSCDDPRSGWQWFIEPVGLIMGRNDPNRVWFT